MADLGANVGGVLGAVLVFGLLFGLPAAVIVDRVMIYRADHKGHAARDAWRSITAAVWLCVKIVLWSALAVLVVGVILLWVLFGPSVPVAEVGSGAGAFFTAWMFYLILTHEPRRGSNR